MSACPGLTQIDMSPALGLQQEVWTEQALSQGMQRISYGISKFPQP